MSGRPADSSRGGTQRSEPRRKGRRICHRHSSGVAGWRGLTTRLRAVSAAAALLLCLVQLPTGALSQSQSPTASPNATTTAIPTAVPVADVTAEPTANNATTAEPTTTAAPVSVAPTTTLAPVTNAPTTEAPSTSAPTSGPTVRETPAPTIRPTPNPTEPLTSKPTISFPPTFTPTERPTVSRNPTLSPTERPTDDPTVSPTNAPTASPTLQVESTSVGFYQQDIIINTEKLFTALEELIFEDLYQSYTPFYGPGADQIDPDDETTIETTCELTTQSLLDAPILNRGNRRLGGLGGFSLGTKWRYSGYFSSAPEHRVLQQTSWKLRVGFTMTWKSRYINVETYSDDFATYINLNLTEITEDMISSGLQTVVEAQEVFKEQKTPAPSPTPTTYQPSEAPSVSPSASPTETPTTARPTAAPVPAPDSEGLSAGAIGAIVAGGSAAALIIGYFLYRSRKQRIEEARQRTARAKKGQGGASSKHQRSRKNSQHEWQSSSRPQANHLPMDNVDVVPPAEEQNATTSPATGPFAYISDRHNDQEANEEDGGGGHLNIPPNDSLVSNQSLISAGLSMSSGSDQEADTRDHLADEFDQYKDQNLEKMRTEVEGTVTNVDGMMSQALTKALMDDDDSQRDMNELRWGGSGNSVEIEASVLCDMNDWLKRKEGASIDERRSFMQETLNKMVASVRHGVISPEDASRTIHECAAMLGLQLAETIPETALIVTGMRKMVKSEDVIEAFKEFGEIEDAAVSPNARGFGLVRFVSPKSVLRAMERFRKEEIVVQDVAVMIKVLKSEDMDMAALGPPSEGDMNRQFSAGQGRAGAVPAGGPARVTTAASSRASAMEAHHAPNLDTIGYPGDSIGRAPDGRGGSRYPGHGHGPGSDTGSGASRGSRTSSRSQGHKGNQSGGETNGNGRRISRA